MEAELESVGAVGVGADRQGVEEAGRVTEAGGMATEVDARAATNAALLPIDGCGRREVEGGGTGFGLLSREGRRERQHDR